MKGKDLIKKRDNLYIYQHDCWAEKIDILCPDIKKIPRDSLIHKRPFDVSSSKLLRWDLEHVKKYKLFI